MTEDSKAYKLWMSRIEDIRAAYADVEPINLPSPMIRVRFAQNETAEIPPDTHEKTKEGPMERDEQEDRTVMVGASFEEIESAATTAVKEAMARELEEITPTITQALATAAETVKEAVDKLLVAQKRLKRYRLAIYLLVLVCGVEFGWIAMMVLHRR